VVVFHSTKVFLFSFLLILFVAWPNTWLIPLPVKAQPGFGLFSQTILSLRIDSPDSVAVDISGHLNRTFDLESFSIVLPFALELPPKCLTSTLVCAAQVTETDVTTIVFIPSEAYFDIGGTSKTLVRVALGQANKVALDFSYGSASPNFRGLLSQASTLSKFDNITVALPDYVDQSQVVDTPAQTGTAQGRVRTYAWNSIAMSGGRLTILYPSEESILIPFGQMVLGCLGTLPGVLAQDTMKRRKRILLLAIGLAALGTLDGYYYFTGPLPFNGYFFLLVPLVLNACVYLYVYSRR
jgi:hypothetical protein